MSYCEDCGTKTQGGICSNCQEELYILEHQAEYVETVNPEFQQKADDQKRLLKARRER